MRTFLEKVPLGTQSARVSVKVFTLFGNSARTLSPRTQAVYQVNVITILDKFTWLARIYAKA